MESSSLDADDVAAVAHVFTEKRARFGIEKTTGQYIETQKDIFLGLIWKNGVGSGLRLQRVDMTKVSCVRSRSLDGVVESCAQYLVELNEKVVFAESCTGGMIASKLAGIPGISNHLCGSFVTYRPKSKQRWLGVSKSSIASHSTESGQVAQEMAAGALKQTPEANWALSIVGHLGPDAPHDKDGNIWVCIARRSSKGKIKIKLVANHKLSDKDRLFRQYLASEAALTLLTRLLIAKKNNEKRKSI